MPVLEVTDAARRYGEIEALVGVDLQLERGEWLGLLGPNGAGKTTLVRAIAGRVRLDRGTVSVFGHRLGVVPQEIAIYPLLTARENLQTFGALQGLRGRELALRIVWALAWTGLAERADQPTQGFSGGMKRRLNIAASVLHRPEVLLLDEPTVGVDPQSRQRIWEMLEELRHGGTSLLLTTHQLDEAQTVCDRIVIIDHGRVIASGTLEELIARTVGTDRRVTLTLEAPLADPAGLGAEVREDGLALSRGMSDLAVGLPALLAEVHRREGKVVDLRVEAPSLQAVFLHLTGRELRE